MSVKGWIILSIVNIPAYFGLGWVLFRHWHNFWDSINFWLTPDASSFLEGEYSDDVWAEFKLFLWVVCCVGCVVGEAYLIGKVFG